QIGKLGSVYAYRSELDKWYRERQPQVENETEEAEKSPPAGTEVPQITGSKSEASPAPAPNVSVDRSKAKLWFKLRWTVGAAMFLSITAGAAYVAIIKPSAHVVRTVDKTRLFVRPFTNSSVNSQQDEFIAGLTEETITKLGRIDPVQLGVIASTASK